MPKRIIKDRNINRCYDCNHCKSKWVNDTFDTPYGTESTMYGHSFCNLDSSLQLSGIDIPKYCPLYGKPKPKLKPNRIIGWYNDITHGDISRSHNGITKIDFIQDEPNGKTVTITVDELEKLLTTSEQNSANFRLGMNAISI